MQQMGCLGNCRLWTRAVLFTDLPQSRKQSIPCSSIVVWTENQHDVEPVCHFVFDAVLLTQLGAENCGCFGTKVSMPPWLMLTIDSKADARRAERTSERGIGRVRMAGDAVGRRSQVWQSGRLLPLT